MDALISLTCFCFQLASAGSRLTKAHELTNTRYQQLRKVPLRYAVPFWRVERGYRAQIACRQAPQLAGRKLPRRAERNARDKARCQIQKPHVVVVLYDRVSIRAKVGTKGIQSEMESCMACVDLSLVE